MNGHQICPKLFQTSINLIISNCTCSEITIFVDEIQFFFRSILYNGRGGVGGVGGGGERKVEFH